MFISIIIDIFMFWNFVKTKSGLNLIENLVNTFLFYAVTFIFMVNLISVSIDVVLTFKEQTFTKSDVKIWTVICLLFLNSYEKQGVLEVKKEK